MARQPGPVKPISLQLLAIVDEPPVTGGRGGGIAEQLAELMADVAPGKWAVVARGDDTRVVYKRLYATALRERFEVRTDGRAVYVRARTEPYVKRAYRASPGAVVMNDNAPAAEVQVPGGLAIEKVVPKDRDWAKPVTLTEFVECYKDEGGQSFERTGDLLGLKRMKALQFRNEARTKGLI